MEEAIQNKDVKLHVRTCPRCKQAYNTKIGIGNWKNLFKAPTPEDWITLIMLALIIAAAYAYNADTKACRETLNNLDTICLQLNKVTNTQETGLESFFVSQENNPNFNSTGLFTQTNSTNSSNAS